MNILIAPDSFKESLTAVEVADAIHCGLAQALPGATFQCLPLADGGEGTVQAMIGSLSGQIMTSDVNDPLGRPIRASWGKANDLAVIEMAAASGLELLQPAERNPMATDSYGTGELILAALNAGCTHIILGLGGSATNDGGAGMLRALGGQLLNAQGAPIAGGGGALQDLASIDLSRVDPRLAKTQFSIACDVSNPLCGTRGASAVFGPQKGASAKMVQQLDDNLNRFARLLQPLCRIDLLTEPGMGAAGGLSLALEAIATVERRSGFELISNTIKLEQQIKWADLVFTGEGKTDHQSLAGKTCFGVARLAQAHQTPVILLSGSLGEDYQQFYQHGIVAAFAATPEPMSLVQAMKNGRKNLSQSANAIGRMIALQRID
ncbi:glycerate kinase [Thalassotalea mangrovi]|uniref:Glycerate kinase n=1 Tax=Thalassotalea mangrovi TaxID=2572245 RepID=A0A4V5NWF6_9GAMM|nr:glycerate kinase [Thalassotalea mangrovi]TKB46665.1 glycerate kinase [Thalassotalea mangrovi]